MQNAKATFGVPLFVNATYKQPDLADHKKIKTVTGTCFFELPIAFGSIATRKPGLECALTP